MNTVAHRRSIGILLAALFFAAASAVPAPAQQSGKRAAPDPKLQDVVTMRGEYEIVPQGDGKHYELHRLAKNGSTYETVLLTKTSETQGEIVYSDADGRKYTRLSDGRLREKISFDSPPRQASRDRAPEPPPELMAAAPIVPRSSARNSVRSSNFTPPAGLQLLRSEGGLLFLTTGVGENLRRHEVVVQKVAEGWYVRISVSRDPDEAPAFHLEPDGSVSGFTQLPPGVPQAAGFGRNPDPPPAVRPPPPPEAAPLPPPPDRRPVSYQGRAGTLISRSDGRSQHIYLNLDGEPDPLELEPVRGNTGLFTPAGRDDVLVRVDVQGNLRLTDTGGQPATISQLRSGRVPAALPPDKPAVAPTPPVALPTPPSSAYNGPTSGTLTCDGREIPQNGEKVFTNLPPSRLELRYDASTWEARLQPGDGATQRLVLRNKKPGVQKKCLVTWTVK